MATYDLAQITQILLLSPIPVFSSASLAKSLDINKERSVYLIIQKLLRSSILEKVGKNCYILVQKPAHQFLIANYYLMPSYISLESALSYYGILSQFPTEVTSITPLKTTKYVLSNQLFSYAHLKKDLYWGYVKRDDGFLIATPEKAILDQAYMASKGLKTFPKDELDWNLVNKKILLKYAKLYPKLPL
jgi:predicted transcriptional regulator of viral defense system